jgi:hypothetical protein
MTNIRVNENFWQTILDKRASIQVNKEQKKEGFPPILSSALEKNELNSSASIWEDIRSKYNIRNASFDEIVEIALRLEEAGQISDVECSILIFPHHKALEYLRHELKGIHHVTATGWLTSANSSGKYDWIAEWEARAKESQRLGLVGFEIDQNIVSVLRKIGGEE